MLEVPSQTNDVLRDRKDFLRFMAAVLGREGVTGVDLLAQTFWTPGRLSDELQHSAPLDIIHIHVLHVVTQPAGPGCIRMVWLKSATSISTYCVRMKSSLRASSICCVPSPFTLSKARLPDRSSLPLAQILSRLSMRRHSCSSAAPSDTALRDPADHSDRPRCLLRLRLGGFYRTSLWD
jgi:hypothetical protein